MAWKEGKLDSFEANIEKFWGLISWLVIYFFLVPYILSMCFRFGVGIKSIKSRYFFMASIYGYSFTPFVPGIMLHCIPNPAVQWASLLLPAASSLFFLTRELFSLAHKSIDSNPLRAVAGFTVILHLLFIGLLKLRYL